MANEFVTRNGFVSLDNSRITGSLNVSAGITGSLLGTASFAATASSADNFLVRQNATASNLLVNNTITAQTLVVQTVTSSIVFSSGSNIFGNQLTNVQQFTGSLRATGSGNHFIMGGNVGINTTSPNTFLTVRGTPSTDYGLLNLYDSRTAAIDQGGSIAFNGFVTGTSIGATFGLIAGRKENSTSGNETGYIGFYPNNGSGVYPERMRVTPTSVVLPGAVYLFYNYNANASSRSWRISNDQIVFGDFTIQQSTTQTGTSYNNIIYSDPNGNIGLSTITPTARLQVSGSNTQGILLINSPASSSILVVSGSGRIGVNKSTPTTVLDVSGSTFITGSLNVSSGITGSLFGTSSWAINANTATTASFALSASFFSGFVGNTTGSFTNQSTWTFNHNLNNQYVIVQTFDTGNNQIIPQNIQLVNANSATITFPTNVSGYAIASIGGGGSGGGGSTTTSGIVSFNLQTGNYTLAASDVGKIVRVNSGSAATVTLPDNTSVPIVTGSFFTIEQTGTGFVTAITGSGVTILPTARTTSGQYTVIQAYKVDTNTWNVLGGIV